MTLPSSVITPQTQPGSAGNGSNGEKPPVSCAGDPEEWHPFDNIVFDDPEEEFVFPVIPIPVWDAEQEMLHTEANDYVCGDPNCLCTCAEGEIASWM